MTELLTVEFVSEAEGLSGGMTSGSEEAVSAGNSHERVLGGSGASVA